MIIPTYNRWPLVKEAINSVLKQSFSDFEVIVVDDGSTDNTREEIEAIKDPRIRYFYKENYGVSTARNLGLAKSTGQYICFLDSDDLWPEHYLQIMIGKLEKKTEYGAAYSARTVLYSDGKSIKQCDPKRSKSGWITKNLFIHKRLAPVHTSGTCFLKNVLQGFSFDEALRNGQDTDAWLRLSTKTKFLFVPDVAFVNRREHGISPRIWFSRENCNRILFLERFYFRLGGDKIITKNQARRKFSHAYRSAGKTHYRMKNRTAAIFLYKRAILYCPYDIRLYPDLLRALLLNKKGDNLPNWRMPDPLPMI